MIFEESVLERRTADAVHEEMATRLAAGDWSADLIATRLGLVNVGVDALMRRRWTFEEAFRIANAVGIDFGSKLSQFDSDAA